MIKKLIQHALKLLESLTGYRIFIYPKMYPQKITASKSRFGFWYAGDIFDKSDIAYGIWKNDIVEKNEVALVREILDVISKDTKIVFYDIGANTGIYTLIASINYPCTVFSFEPVPEHIAILRENIKLNKIGDVVTVMPLALGAEKADLQMYVDGSGSSLFLKESYKTAKPTITVEVTSIDLLFSEHTIPKPDFLKIDVEEYEGIVLQGALKTITKYKPVIFIELINRKNTPEYSETLVLLTEIGYTVHCLQNNTLIPTKDNCTTQGVHMYLAIHPDTHSNLFETLKIN